MGSDMARNNATTIAPEPYAPSDLLLHTPDTVLAPAGERLGLVAAGHAKAGHASFSTDVVWLVLPSLVLFGVLPTLLRLGVGFWWSLAAGIAATALAYWGSVQLMTWFRG